MSHMVRLYDMQVVVKSQNSKYDQEALGTLNYMHIKLID